MSYERVEDADWIRTCAHTRPRSRGADTSFDGCWLQKVFSEKASRAKRDRSELQAAIDYARKDNTVMVWRLDRLARSLKQLIETIEGLEDRGIGFRSLTEIIDITSPGGRLVCTIFSGLAEFERSIIRERTVAGLEAARSRGRVGGRLRSVSDEDIAAAKAMLKVT